ncbi:MAG: MBL fold metallo-hydrolase [Candidatus Methylomirabilis sp.]|nr:MBL fold metallo-hydrolase [Deltaproteobacteria bacterium]
MTVIRLRCSTTDNYHYLIACRATRKAAAVDPLDVGLILETARREGLAITHVLNTHTHWDHVGGNEELLAETRAALVVNRIEADAVEAERLEAIEGGDAFKVGDVEVRTLHTPGHTPGGTTFIVGKNLIVGDTLFVAGCGNPNYGGNAEQLYETVARRLRAFPDDFTVWPGHNYCDKNLRFALDVEPSKAAAKRFLDEVRRVEAGGAEPRATTIGDEKAHNPFFRLDSAALLARLRETKPDLAGDARGVFLALRARRDVF